MADAIRVLHVEGDAEFASTTADSLEGESGRIEVVTASDPDDALARIADGGVDCVVSGYDLPGMDGIELLEEVQAAENGPPFILFTEDGSQEIARQALSKGASDYVVRADGTAQDALLANRIENAVALHRQPRGQGQLTVSNRAETATDSEWKVESYRRIIEEMGDTLYAIDPDGDIVHVNPAISRVSGYDVEEIVEAGPELVYEEADIEAFEEAITDLLADDDRQVARVEADMQTRSGDTASVEVTITTITDDAGEFAGTIGVVRDITDRKERERELREYETIVRALPDEVAILDTDGYLTRYIPPTGSETGPGGYSPEELEGKHVSTVMTDEALERGEELIAELVTTDRERVAFDMQAVGKDGELYWREDNLALLRDDDGEVQGTVGVLRDIEERKAYERELERQNERLEEFAEIASHDLRNPLSVAQGHLELVEQECETDHAGKVANALHRMERLIEDTLTMARGGATVSERTAVELSTFLPTCWKAVGTDAGRLEVVDEVTVAADGDRLRQLLENLLRNAVEHGGEDVTVRVGAIDESGVYVADDGPGIPEGEREHVFDAGYTTASEGTGFGLAIVGEIVDAHGWEVAVTESEDGGARFEITGVDLRS